MDFCYFPYLKKQKKNVLLTAEEIFFYKEKMFHEIIQ